MKRLAENDELYNDYWKWKYEGPSQDWIALMDLGIVHSGTASSASAYNTLSIRLTACRLFRSLCLSLCLALFRYVSLSPCLFRRTKDLVPLGTRAECGVSLALSPSHCLSRWLRLTVSMSLSLCLTVSVSLSYLTLTAFLFVKNVVCASVQRI